MGGPDCVFITGDVAFAANPNEYKKAKEWIDELLKETQTPKDRLYIVPGNHDVNRNFTARTGIETIYKDIRTSPVKKLDKYLEDSKAFKSFIWPKFKAFSNFVSRYGVPNLTSATPFWTKKQTISLGNTIIVGLNTVLLSFSDDDAPNKLGLDISQIQKVHEQPEDSLLLVLQHHPPEWLFDEKDFKSLLCSRPHILFCGHTHHEIGEIRHPIHTGGLMYFVAGASYSHEEGDHEKYSYSWGQLFSNGIRYYPRVWVESQFKADRNRYNLDENDAVFIPSMNLPMPLCNWLGRLSPFSAPFFAENDEKEWIPVFHGELGILCIKIDMDIPENDYEYCKHVADRISTNLQKATKNETIKVLAFTRGGSVNVILKGRKEGFETIIKLHEEGSLSNLLGMPVINIRHQIQVQVYGATIKTKTSSAPFFINITSDTQRDDLMISPSNDYKPPMLTWIKAFVEGPLYLDFLIDLGDAKRVLPVQEERFVDYFCSGLTIKDEDMWVNLSAYESKRMIPNNLAKTKLGKDLLAQDCILKRFTASLLHPDSEWGKRYWNRVYNEAEQLSLMDRTPTFDSYQKVWVTPGEAEVYVKELPSELSEEESKHVTLRHMIENEKRKGYFAIITKNELKVMCETDYSAITETLKDRENLQEIKSFNDLCTSIFKEIILPVIEKEVNHGKNFIIFRQIYNALILANFCKKYFRDYPKWREFVDSGQKVTIDIKSQTDISNGEDKDFKFEDIEEKFLEYTNIEQHLLPDFDPTQEDVNSYFYNQYIDLFKKGLYICTRKHFNPVSQKIFTRTYFSGGMRFNNFSSSPNFVGTMGSHLEYGIHWNSIFKI